MGEIRSTFKKTLAREAAWFLTLFFVGLVLMPIAIYVVGRNLFGDYGGAGYSEFFNMLSGKVRVGDRSAWFLILSPYIAWQSLRLTLYGWRRMKSARIGGPGDDSRPSQNT